MVSIRDTTVTVMSGWALMATAGFSISTKGWAIMTIKFELASAIPLKNPATPTPRGIHIFSKREETNSINDNTGMDVRKEYPAKRTSVPISNAPSGKSVMPICISAKFCSMIATKNMTVSIRNLHRYIAGTLMGSIYIFLMALPLNSML